MSHITRPAWTTRLVAIALGSVVSVAALSLPVRAFDSVADVQPRPDAWLLAPNSSIDLPASPKSVDAERAALARIVAKRTADDIALHRWWSVGGPVHRWNELALQEMQESFVVLPMAARHLALLHVALDDAAAAARGRRPRTGAPANQTVDAALNTKRTDTLQLLAPSEHAAVAITAAEVLGYLFPARAQHFAAKAEEAIEARLRAGVELPAAVTAGRAVGHRVGTLAIARGKSDGSDTKWAGTIPDGPGAWKGTNPIAPAAAKWTPWVLSSPSEFRPAPPPAVGSDAVKAALAELKSFARTPKSSHRAVYWEVHGGARAHTLWNEIARTKLLEHGFAPEMAARVLAVLNVAMADAGTACWDAKYTYWYIRPSQLDADLKALFPPPNHPSFPAAHGCYSTAAATVLARIFPRDGESLRSLGKEAAEARVWAGIHYRFDIDAGQEIGRKVAEKALARAFMAKTN
ncbi:MAG: phosphatase PAP2 family protein [Hyphomicrobiaceae bacterium]